MKERADKLGILGTVQNVADGSVLIIAQAEETILNDFLDQCRKGSPLSKVADLIVEVLVPQDFSSFKILK